MPTLATRLALSAIEVPIAAGLGFAAFWGVFEAGCSISHCVDMSGVPWALLGIVVGPVLGIGYWIVALRMGARFRRRLVWDGVALTIALGAYLVPLILSERATARSLAANAKLNQDRKRDRAEWIESLKAHSHGAPGEVPPMLTVDDEGKDAVVTNLSDRWTSVALARVLPDPTATGGFRACPMYAASGGVYHFSVGPKKSERYWAALDCAKVFEGAPIEYRVGDDPREQGWWSDSALATPDWPSPAGPDRAMPVYSGLRPSPQINLGIEPKAR